MDNFRLYGGVLLMDIIYLAFLLVACALITAVLVCVFVLIKKSNRNTEHKDNEKLQRQLADEFERNRREMSVAQNDMRAQTAQSIGEMVKKLEKELGFPLFDRSKTP